ncbi:Ca2+-binding RTX toxin-like protein, partial [Nitrosomonas sp. Nm84]|uniref:DUF4214 domain-containing protein n=1 Tax=Nitrosomonas sp. Nm84 TaxID=200124 RepID=UPI000D94E5A3
WRWVTGPEAGTQFWSGAANGSSVSGQYNHWESADPNNLNGIEDHARLALNGFWNDLPENTPGVQGYVVEYGGTGFGALGAVPLTITVNTVNDAPVLNNLNGDVAATTVNRAVPIDTGTAATITDVDATDFNMGTLVITTTSGTANGSFSLDGVSAASGGNNKLAAGETVTVGGVAIGTVHATNDGQNGRTLTITLNGGATVANVSELIKSIGYKSATAGLRDFNLALSESNGQTTNAVFSIRIQKTSSNTTSSIVDGDTVRITKTNSDDMIVTATTASIVDSSRIEDTTTQHRTLADIPLANDQNGQPTLLASLPVGVGFTSESMSSKKLLTLRDHLIHASQPRINNEVIFDGVLHNGIDKYVETVVDENQATIRTITFTSKANQAIEEAIIIKGASGAGEDDPNNPLRHEALVIDTRNLPKGTEIRLDNAEFAIIVGSGRFVGGSGRNYVVADEADQFIALGAGDDVLRGGDGNDTIGSRGGNDQLFGDNGNDHLVGGEGNDILNGGDGNDLLQGETSNAGNVTYSLDSQGNVLSTLHPLDLALADPVSTDWYSDKGRVTSDDRVAFVYRDINQLKIISTLYQAVTHQLPTTEEMNYWSSQKISATQASQIAYNHYLVVSGGVAGQATEIQLSQLIDYVWGAGSANDDLVNRGIEFLDNGGSWGDALLYLASHENLTNQLRDLNGNLQLTQDLLIGEVGISVDGGDDTLNGGLGDDVLVGGGGHNFIDGGDGIDTVHVMEGLSAHHIALTKDGLISIARNDGQAINDLRSVEKIVFSDQTLDINFANLDAQTLKQVASITHLMDRNANLWTQLDHFASSNLTINEYSQSLMQSSSHQEDWAALSNQEFVVQLSEAVLGQPLAGDDLNYWTDQLDQGLSQRSDLFVTAVGVNEYQNALFANDGLILL